MSIVARVAESSNGRTIASEAVYLGSSPSSAALVGIKIINYKPGWMYFSLTSSSLFVSSGLYPKLSAQAAQP